MHINNDNNARDTNALSSPRAPSPLRIPCTAKFSLNGTGYRGRNSPESVSVGCEVACIGCNLSEQHKHNIIITS